LQGDIGQSDHCISAFRAEFHRFIPQID